MRATALVCLFLSGCVYDYSALEKPAGDAGSSGSISGDDSGGGGSTSHPGGKMSTTPDSGAGGVGASGGVGVIFVMGSGGSVGATSGDTHSGGTAGTGGARGAGAGGATVGGVGGAGGGGARGAAGDLGATGGGKAGAGGGASLTILSIDFVGGLPVADGAAGITAAPALTSTDVAGAKPAAHWNSAFGAAGVLSSLTLSDGTLSSAKLTWSSPPTAVTAPGVWRLQLSGAGADAIMMDGYLDPTSSALPATILVANLPASLASVGYDVYVYCLGDIALASETRTYKYTIGATSITVSQSGTSPTTFGGFQMVAQNNGTGNYVVFHNVTGTTFSLVATPGTGDFKRAPVNGIQIVSGGGGG
jgi:hypothetical protein